MRAMLTIGKNSDFDKEVLIEILETLRKSPRPVSGSDIIVGLNSNDNLLAQLPSGMLLFPKMQLSSYAGDILKFAVSKGWVRGGSKNAPIRGLVTFQYTYSITPDGKNALRDKESIPAPTKVADLPPR